jgi:hypothetical protein
MNVKSMPFSNVDLSAVWCVFGRHSTALAGSGYRLRSYATIVAGGDGLDGSSRERYRSTGKTKMPPKLMPSKPIGVMWCRICGSICRSCARHRSRVACI